MSESLRFEDSPTKGELQKIPIETSKFFSQLTILENLYLTKV